MTLKDISSGPDWIIWVVGIILAIFSIILLTGRGANLIAGYNTASKEKRINTMLRDLVEFSEVELLL